jgi:hypothetical protein
MPGDATTTEWLPTSFWARKRICGLKRLRDPALAVLTRVPELVSRQRRALIVGVPNLLGSGHRRGPVAVTFGVTIAVGGSLVRLGGSVESGATV